MQLLDPPPIQSVIVLATACAATHHKTGVRAEIIAEPSPLPDRTWLCGMAYGPDPPDRTITVIFLRAGEVHDLGLGWKALDTWIFVFPKVKFVDDTKKGELDA